MQRKSVSILATVFVLLLIGTTLAAAEVSTVKLPPFAFRPQVMMDGRGTLHVVCAHAEKHGDLVYLKRKSDEERFSEPIPVNSTPNCAAAFNAAIGKNGRIHVLIRPNAKYSKDVLMRQPKFVDLKFMLYCRLNDKGTKFEEERDLSGATFAFEGVGAILADAKGAVRVFWHGLSKPGREPTRRIYVIESKDEGKTFTELKPIETGVTGTCACCSMQGMIGANGAFYLVFRNSEANGSKDSYLLTSKDQGKTFSAKLLGRWPDAGCPGSTYSIAAGKTGVFVAWDNLGHVYFAKVDENLKRIAAPANGRRSRGPVVATNATGEVLFAWAEADNPRQFQKGGDLAWRVYDKDGKPTSKKHVLHAGVARWSSPAVYVQPNGDFVILYDGAGAPK